MRRPKHSLKTLKHIGDNYPASLSYGRLQHFQAFLQTHVYMLFHHRSNFLKKKARTHQLNITERNWDYETYGQQDWKYDIGFRELRRNKSTENSNLASQKAQYRAQSDFDSSFALIKSTNRESIQSLLTFITKRISTTRHHHSISQQILTQRACQIFWYVWFQRFFGLFGRNKWLLFFTFLVSLSEKQIHNVDFDRTCWYDILHKHRQKSC